MQAIRDCAGNTNSNANKASDFKLTYFNCRGRGELARLIFAKSGTPYEDDRVEFSDWPEKKGSTPMGMLPVLTHKDQVLTQSLVINRFIARKCKLVGKGEMDEFLSDQFVSTLWLDVISKLAEIFHEKDEEKKEEMIAARRASIVEALFKLSHFVKGEFVLGKTMSYADLALLDLEPWVALTMPQIQTPEKLKEVIRKVEADPKIAGYLASRPAAAF